MSLVDLRGFRYPLEPLLHKQQWRVDALQARLAAADKLVEAARQVCRDAQSALDACAHGLRQPGGGKLDPQAYGRGLAYLAALQTDLARNKLHLEQLRLDRDALREAYLQAQCKVDLTIEHKDECLKEYVLAEQNRVSSEVDRDWLARACEPGLAGQHMEQDE
jgi:peptidyl-tRNA hydrolase